MQMKMKFFHIYLFFLKLHNVPINLAKYTVNSPADMQRIAKSPQGRARGSAWVGVPLYMVRVVPLFKIQKKQYLGSTSVSCNFKSVIFLIIKKYDLKYQQ